MAKRKLAAAAGPQPKKSALDLAEEQEATPPPQTPTGRRPSVAEAKEGTRATQRISISLLPEERVTLEERARGLQSAGRRDIKTSRLARVAFKLLERTPDDEVLRLADDVPNLEQLRVKPR